MAVTLHFLICPQITIAWRFSHLLSLWAILEYLHSTTACLIWTYFGPTRFIHRWTTVVHVMLRVSDITGKWNSWLAIVTFDWPSRKLLCIKVTPDLHLTHSKSGGNLGLVLKMKNIACISNLLTKHVKYTSLYLFKFVLYSIAAFEAN